MPRGDRWLMLFFTLLAIVGPISLARQDLASGPLLFGNARLAEFIDGRASPKIGDKCCYRKASNGADCIQWGRIQKVRCAHGHILRCVSNS